MKDTYMSFDEWCIDFNATRKSGQRTIVNGWDCTYLPPRIISFITKYDSVESLTDDILTRGTYLPKFRMYELDGVRFELGTTWRYQKEQQPAGLHVEGCRTGGEFTLERLMRETTQEENMKKDYLHYENWTEEDVQNIATNYSTIDIYDFICTQGLEDAVWDDWSDLETDADKVRFFLEIQKYPSIAMRELDEYVQGDAFIVNQCVASYEEMMDMGDPCSEEARRWILDSVVNGNFLMLIEGIAFQIEERELNIANLPETAKALHVLAKYC